MPRKPAKVSYSGKIAKRRVRRAKLRIVFLACIPIFLITGFVFLMRISAFQVTKVSVEGLQTVREQDITARVNKSLSGKYLFVIPKTNMFFIDNKKLAAALTSEFGRLQSAKVKTGVSGDLEVKVEERTPEAIWCNGSSECFLMSKDGVIFALATREEMQDKVIFRGASKKIASTTLSQFGWSERLPSYYEIINFLKSKNFDVSTVVIESDDKGALDIGVAKIIFNPNDKKLQSSIENALLVIDNVHKEKPDATFAYIDVRFGTKVYYKTN